MEECKYERNRLCCVFLSEAAKVVVLRSRFRLSRAAYGAKTDGGFPGSQDEEGLKASQASLVLKRNLVFGEPWCTFTRPGVFKEGKNKYLDPIKTR